METPPPPTHTQTTATTTTSSSNNKRLKNDDDDDDDNNNNNNNNNRDACRCTCVKDYVIIAKRYLNISLQYVFYLPRNEDMHFELHEADAPSSSKF